MDRATAQKRELKLIPEADDFRFAHWVSYFYPLSVADATTQCEVLN